MRSLILISTFMMVGCSTTLSVDNDETKSFITLIECNHTDGFIDGPFVSDELVARQIAGVVVAKRQSIDYRERYDIVAIDAGRHWVLSQVLRDKIQRIDSDALIVTAGGGGLSMRIAKCDGAISNVHGIR